MARSHPQLQHELALLGVELRGGQQIGPPLERSPQRLEPTTLANLAVMP
jgi:hypothetical protein